MALWEVLVSVWVLSGVLAYFATEVAALHCDRQAWDRGMREFSLICGVLLGPFYLLIAAEHVQKCSLSSIAAGHNGHEGGYSGLYLWTTFPTGRMSFRYLTSVDLCEFSLLSALPWETQSIISNSSSLHACLWRNFAFIGGTVLAKLSSRLMS